MENFITNKQFEWKSPFIDVFFYDIIQVKDTNQTMLQEVNTAGEPLIMCGTTFLCNLSNLLVFM
jgi:hypothetical protein